MEGQNEVTLANGGVLTNPYHFVSEPKITISGNGEGTLTIQSANLNATWAFTDVDDLTIDSEQMFCYSGTESRNDTLSGEGLTRLKQWSGMV